MSVGPSTFMVLECMGPLLKFMSQIMNHCTGFYFVLLYFVYGTESHKAYDDCTGYAAKDELESGPPASTCQTKGMCHDHLPVFLFCSMFVICTCPPAPPGFYNLSLVKKAQGPGLP